MISMQGVFSVWEMLHEGKSPNYTTAWDEVPVVLCVGSMRLVGGLDLLGTSEVVPQASILGWLIEHQIRKIWLWKIIL